MNRRVVDSTESTVDFADQLIDTCSQILVLFDILSRWDGQLDQHDLGQRVSTRSKGQDMTILTFSTHSGCWERKISKLCSF